MPALPTEPLPRPPSPLALPPKPPPCLGQRELVWLQVWAFSGLWIALLATTASECPDEAAGGAAACVGWCVWLATFALFDLGSGLGPGGNRRLPRATTRLRSQGRSGDAPWRA